MKARRSGSCASGNPDVRPIAFASGSRPFMASFCYANGKPLGTVRMAGFFLPERCRCRNGYGSWNSRWLTIRH